MWCESKESHLTFGCDIAGETSHSHTCVYKNFLRRREKNFWSPFQSAVGRVNRNRGFSVRPKWIALSVFGNLYNYNRRLHSKKNILGKVKVRLHMPGLVYLLRLLGQTTAGCFVLWRLRFRYVQFIQ